MASPAARRAAAAHVGRICESVDDTRALRSELLSVIRRIVDFDAYVWLLTDPETSVGSSPLADVPCLPELPSLIRAKYLTSINRWTTLHTPPVATLHAATGGELSRSLVWREVLSRYDVSDVASAVFADQFGCWGFLDLWRSGGSSSRFSPSDVAFLIEIEPAITTALRRSQAVLFAERAEPEPHHPGPVVLLLAPDLQVRAQTPETAAHLRALVPPPGAAPPVPASAYNVAAQLLAGEAGVDPGPAWARVHLSGRRWMTLRAARIGTSSPAAAQDIAVTMDETSPGERLGLFARAVGLTARESELLTELASGADTRELARRLSLSEHTVQDHLKAIFAKTSAHTRRSLLARALGS